MVAGQAKGVAVGGRGRWWSKKPTVVLLAIVVLAAGLRLYGLSANSLWYDEAVTVQLSEHAGFNADLFDTTKNFEAPLMAVAVKVWRLLVGFSERLPLTSPYRDFLLRLLPALASIACVPVLYHVTVALVRDRNAGLIAAFLFAISPFHVFYAQELRGYALTSLLGLAALYYVIRALETNRFRDYGVLLVLLVLLVSTHFTNVWAVFVFNVYALAVVIGRPDRFWRWTLCQLAMLLILTPVLRLAYEANQIFLRVKHAWPTYPTPTPKTALITFKTFFAGYGPTVWAYWPLFLLGLLLTILGIVALRHRWRQAVLVALLIFLPIGANIIFWRMRQLSLYEHRIFIFYGVVALIAVANGIRMLPNRNWRAVALAAMIVLTVPGLRDYYLGRLHPVLPHRIGIFDKVDFRESAQMLATQWREGDVLTHDSLFTIPSMQYYLPVAQYHLGPTEQDAQAYIDAMAIEAILRGHGLLPVDPEEVTREASRVWLIEAFGITFDDVPQSIPAREWLSARFALQEEMVFDGLRVLRFVPADERAGNEQ